MDIDPTIVKRILLPLAIIEDEDRRPYTTIPPQSETYSCSPQTPVPETWSIDGGDPAYFRFFAIPNFARGRPPLQVFVIVPLDQMAIDPGLVESLELNGVFSSTKAELPTLPLAKHLVRALSRWSFVYPDFKEAYLSMPYGSHIVVENLHEDIRQMRIHLSPSYALEHEWLSVPIFQTQTGLDLSSLIDLLDWTELELDRHLHDSISLVRIPSKTGSQLMVYKAVTADVQYMYHELRTVLSMEEHSRIIARPRYLVVKQCRFGGKVGICGFVLEYHPHGSLQTALQAGQPISLLQKLYWAQQLTVVLIHIRDNGPGFYSDLKPNNILLEQTAVKGLTAPLLIDFEQCGSWYSWSPFEVQFVDYLDMLANKASTSCVRKKYSKVLCQCISGWSANYKRRPLVAAPDGYNLGWTTLGPSERRKAQIFCLGKLLWCIFEELPSCNTFLTIETFAEGIDQTQSFPEFQKTPTELRELILRCTTNVLECEEFPICRKGKKLVPKYLLGDSEASLKSNDMQHLAREWWRKRVAIAEEFIQSRREDISISKGRNTTGKRILETPMLEEVMDALISFSIEAGIPLKSSSIS